jgi:hypothetical protein
MTQEQVIVTAQNFVIGKGYQVLLEPEAIRLLSADRFNALFGRIVYPGDFWTVEFRKILPPEVMAESPSTVMIEVVPDTGEVREVYVGMHIL